MTGYMEHGRLALGVILVTLVAIAIGYVLASAVLTFRDLGFRAEIDFVHIAQNYLVIRDIRPDDFRLINLIMGGAGVAGLMLSLAMSGSALLPIAEFFAGFFPGASGRFRITLSFRIPRSLGIFREFMRLGRP